MGSHGRRSHTKHVGSGLKASIFCCLFPPLGLTAHAHGAGIRDDAKLHRLEAKGSRGLFEVTVSMPGAKIRAQFLKRYAMVYTRQLKTTGERTADP